MLPLHCRSGGAGVDASERSVTWIAQSTSGIAILPAACAYASVHRPRRHAAIPLSFGVPATAPLTGLSWFDELSRASRPRTNSAATFYRGRHAMTTMSFATATRGFAIALLLVASGC